MATHKPLVVNGGQLEQLPTGDVLEGGSGVSPFRGARISLPSMVTCSTLSSWTPIPFAPTAADYDTSGFWSSGSPNRFTIPAGVTKVRLTAALQADSSNPPESNQFCFLRGGATAWAGNNIAVLTTAGYTNPGTILSSGVLDVSPGDYFEVGYWISGSVALENDRGTTWFAIEVVESTYSNASLGELLDVTAPAPVDKQALQWSTATSQWEPASQPYDATLFYPGKPAAGAIMAQLVAARTLTFADDFAGSLSYAGVTATASAVFDVQVNGSSVGSITFGIGSNTATFATTGAGQTVTAGQRLTVIAPDPQDATLANISLTLVGTR